MKFDTDGLIVQSDGDGGDCAARTGELVTGLILSNSVVTVNVDTNAYYSPQGYFSMASKQLQSYNGPQPQLLRYRRYPYNDPADCSRDQTLPMVIAAGFVKDSYFINQTIQRTMLNLMRFQNGDICSPEHFAVFLRASRMAQKPSRFKAITDYPFLLLGDLFTLFNSVVRVVMTSLNQDDVGDWVNHVQVMLQAVHYRPTPFSFLSRQMAKLVKGGVQRCLDWYHRPESGGNPINGLYRPEIERWLK